MKKLIVLILSLQIVSSGQFLNELLKLRNLVHHYIQHNEQDGNINLAAFLRLHYFDEKHEESDLQNHDMLPLHHCHGSSTPCCSNFSFNGFIEQMNLDINTVAIMLVLTPHSSHFTDQFRLQSIFQPPRLT